MRTHLRHPVGMLLLLASEFSLLGQNSNNAAPPPKTTDVVELSPFEVSSHRDTGYRATKSTTSTGISLDIAKTPLNIQVVTGTFIEDLNLDNMHQAIRYVSGVQNDEFNRDASGVRIRGMQVGNFYRNGNPRPFNFSTDNVDRIEVVKGPVATFFGQGNPGGIINYITKKPEFTTGGISSSRSGATITRRRCSITRSCSPCSTSSDFE